jgi:hypothetical protein
MTKGGVLDMNHDKDLTDEKIKNKLNKNSNEIPDVVRMRIDHTLETLPNKNMKRGSIRNIIQNSIAAVAISFGLLIAGSIASPQMAQALKDVPFVGSVFQTIGKFGLKSSSEMGLTSQVNQTATDQGVTITVQEVLYDGIELSIGFLLDGSSTNHIKEIDLYANGKRINAGSGESGRQVDEQLYAAVRSFTVTEQLPDQFDLKINIKSIDGFVDGEHKEIKGKWNFNIPVTKLTKEVITYEFADRPSITLNNETLTAEKATFSPARTAIYLEYIEPLDSAHLQRDSDINLHKSFQIIDDQGLIWEPEGGSGSGRSNEAENIFVNKIQVKLSTQKRVPEYILIRPIVETYKVDRSNKNSTTQAQAIPIKSAPVFADSGALDTQSLPLKLNQGPAGNLTLTGLDISTDSIH